MAELKETVTASDSYKADVIRADAILKCSVITPERTLFSGPALMVVAPGVEGDFGVLPGHAPFISALRAGTITIDTDGGEQKSFEVTGGFAEVVPERCTLLISTAV